jgi:type I restriction enzyme S subunit
VSNPGWTTRLPENWKVARLRHIASVSNSNVDKKSYKDGIPVRLCNYTDVYYNDFITDNMKLMKATATSIEIRRFSLHPGDVVITKDSEAWDDIAVPACVSEPLDNVLCGYHLSIFRPHPTMLDGRFLLRTIQANGVREQFWVEARGVTRFGLGQDGMKDALLPLPPIPTQKSIANYLDHKTAAIDSLIEKKRRLLDLLAEERTALINQAVTKGLDPDVPMKDSGIPTVGTVPTHWVVVRNKVVLREITDLSKTGKET